MNKSRDLETLKRKIEETQKKIILLENKPKPEKKEIQKLRILELEYEDQLYEITG